MLHKIESPLLREKGIQFSDCIRFSKELALKRVSNSQSLVCTHLVFFFVLNWFPTPQAKDTRELPQGVLLTPASLHSTVSPALQLLSSPHREPRPFMLLGHHWQCPSPTRWLGSEAQERQQGMELCFQPDCQGPLFVPGTPWSWWPWATAVSKLNSSLAPHQAA